MSKTPDYSSFFFYNPLPSWIYEIETFRVLEVNEAALSHYGYTREEFLSLTLKDLRPEQEIAKLVTAHADIHKHDGNIYFGVFTHRKKAGDLIRMKINGHKVDYLGNECMMVVCQDVTAEEEQVRLLRESEERLKAATSIAKLGYWRLETDADTLSWSDEVYGIWGRRRVEFDVNVENFYRTIHPDDREAFDEAQRAAFAGEKELDFVHRIFLPDQSIRWVHELGRLVKDEERAVAFEGTVQDITAQKEVELRLVKAGEQLRESEQRFRITQDISPDGFTILHPVRNEQGDVVDFTWVYENPAIARINGTDPNEVVGKRLLDLFPSHRNTAILQSYIKVANTGESEVIDEVYVGEIVSVPTWLRIVIVSMGDDIAILNQNITERKMVEEAIRESEARFRTIFEIASLGIVQVDPSTGQIILVNSYYEIITGYTVDELRAMSFVELTHPDDRKRDWELFSRAAQGEGEYRNEKRYVKKDGTIAWVRLHVAFIRDESGKPIRTVAICEEITSRKKEEQQLKLLESVIVNANDAVMITEAEPIDKPGPRIIYVNEAFTKMAGYTADEVIGKTPRILQGPKSDRAELARLKKALQNFESCEITTINYKKSGEEFWINFTVSPVAKESGRYTHWIAVEKDVTVQKEKELEKELLGKISFDFNAEDDLITSVKKLCHTVGEYGSFDFVEMWLPNLENTRIRLAGNKSRTPEAEIFSERSKDILSFDLNQGLPGRVWSEKASLLWKDIGKNEDFVRKEAAVAAGIKTALGIPLLFNQNVVGVLVIGTQRDVNFLRRYVNVFEQLEEYIGSEINRKKLENDLQHLYDAIPDIICITDLKGRFLKMNKAGCELMGYSEDEILYDTFEKFVHPEDVGVSHKDLKKLHRGLKTFGFENRYVTGRGEIIWLSWTSNSNLQEGLIYATARNITAEKHLRELNRQATQLAKIGSWEVDFVQKEHYWSDIVHELHETDPKSFVPDLASGINFYREDFRAAVQTDIERSMTTGESFDFEAVLVTARRNERWVRAIGNTELIDGQCKRIYGSFQDIHDRKEAELRRQSLADNLPGVVFQYVLYPDGRDELKYVTKGAMEIWGLSTEEVIENNQIVWDQIKAGGNFDEVSESIAEAVRSKSKWTASWKNVMPSGEVKTHLGYGSPHFLPDGSVIFNSVILDVTQEAKNEELLEQATEMAKIGSWELDLLNNNGDAMYWSPMTKRILEVDEAYNPSLTGGFEFYTEESRHRIRKAVDDLIEFGKDFDEELLLMTGSDREKWIRCIGKSERVQGKCIKIYGSFQDIHASKSLELRIREILGSISDAFYSVDGEWNFTYFNREAERLLKRKESEVIGKQMWMVFPKVVGTPLEEIYRRVVQTQNPESFEYLFPGDGKWYEVNAYPSGRGLSAYFKNIDERKQVAEALEKAYREKNSILESIGDAFFAVDNDWTVTYWNKEAEALIGRKRERTLGLNLWEVFPDAAKLEFYRQYRKAMDTGETVSFEEYYPGVKKWFEVSAYPSQQGLSIYFKDVTLRKEADIRLQEANERFEKVTQATNDAIWDWDMETGTFFRSDAIDKFFGKGTVKKLSEKEFWHDKFHPEDLDKIKESISVALGDQLCNRWEQEYRIFNRRGKTVYVIDRGIIMRDESGKPVRMLGAMTDITERKNFEEQLLELNESLKQHTRELELTNEQLEQFAFIASHDLQEPLRMISGFMDQLKRKYGEHLDERGHQYIHYATDGAKRMKQIILDLLDYSRAGRMTEPEEAVDMNEILADYRHLRRKVIDEKSVEITAGELPVVQSYKAPLVQALHCLLDNAVKYSEEGRSPRIDVSARESDDSWVISVEDNGIGIESQFFDKIFVIFQRLHNRDEYEGTGIGLSVVKKHVESWRGEIWLESQPGKGSIFYFTIPK